MQWSDGKGKEHEPDCEITINDAARTRGWWKENYDEELESENEGDIHHLVTKLKRQVELFNEKLCMKLIR